MKTMRKTILEQASDLCAATLQPACDQDWDDGDGGYRRYDGGIDPIVAEHARLCRERERFQESRRAMHAYAPSPCDDRDRYDADGAPGEADHPDMSNGDAWYRCY